MRSRLFVALMVGFGLVGGWTLGAAVPRPNGFCSKFCPVRL